MLFSTKDVLTSWKLVEKVQYQRRANLMEISGKTIDFCGPEVH